MLPENVEVFNFKHDCARCVYLEDIKDEEGNKFDLYFCKDMGVLLTIVARYGNEGHQYMSGTNPKLYVFAVGIQRAKAKGLLS